MTIYAVDDHPMLLDAVVMAMRRLRPHSNIVELSSLAGLDDALINHGPPDLVSLDINLPDNDSDDGVAKVRSMFPKAQIAVFSGRPSSEMEEACVASGADIYIEKARGRNEYAAALRALLAAAPSSDDFPSNGAPDFKLSKRQRQLVTMMDRGMTNAEMATSLGLIESSVKVHLWRLYRKLGVNNRSRALFIVRANHLLD
ncbi:MULTISPECIES: response regulator transcription factor [unclassified Variovorax]|uniref:response regulator transcription factor n=1 Tax=unclassified Variovorax TaxID=663243 RepID=UPI000838F483|nr:MULTISPECIES: response regulator transcription factor [unclassified Variovorax]